MANDKQDVYRNDINAFSKGMDSDTKDPLIPKDSYRYGENVRVNNGVLITLDGSTKQYNLEPSTGVNNVTVLSATLSRVLVRSEDKTIDGIVVFYIESYYDNSTPKLKCKIIPVNQSYNSYQMFSESIDPQLEEEYKNTTIDIEKIGQSGYDTIYFVDNVRPPRKLELIIESTNVDYVNVSLGSITKRAGVKIYDIVINVNVVDGEDSNTIVGANNNFIAYVRAYRKDMLPSHPSANASTTRLKQVSFTVGQSTKTAVFTIYPQDLDSWVFNLFYYKEGVVSYTDFIIGTPDKVIVDVGVLPESQKFIARSSQLSEGAITSVDSWDFITNGPIFNYFIDTPSLNVGVTKIYKSNLEDISNYVADGYHQHWSSPTINYHFRVVSGVITEYAINSGLVVVGTTPVGYQGYVDLVYTSTMFNRLSTVEITVPAIIETDSFKRAIIGNSPTLLNNELSYQLLTKDQLEIDAIYQDLVIIKIETIFSEQENSIYRNYIRKTYRYSVESPVGASVTFDMTAQVSASLGDINERAVAYLQIPAAATYLSATPAPGDPSSYTEVVQHTIAPGSYMDVLLEIETNITAESQTATAQSSLEFDVVTMIGSGVPTKIRLDGTLLDYNIITLRQLING